MAANTTVVLTVLALLLGASGGRGQSPGDPRRGRDVYDRYCVQCHGPQGDGRGETARWLQPKPRDFRQGIFKFSSTPFGSLPTIADLDRVIQDGLYGTRMPPFDALNPRAIRDVVAYLQTFSPRWQTEPPETSVVVPAEPVPTRDAVTRGRELYEANCAKCHGDGTGNGPSAAKLVDDWRQVASPTDLTLGRGKWARTARDLYLRVMTGINGTPMPESADALTSDQVWEIVQYVQALGAWSGSTPELRAFVAQLPPPGTGPQ